jgi:threonine dehydratase
MPKISPPVKIAATRGYGAEVIFSGSTSVEREAVTQEVIARTGARLVPPYDHPDIVLGQGTMGLELAEQAAEMMRERNLPQHQLDAIIAPCGGGGMLSGVALSAEGTGIRVFGAEPTFEGADDATRGYYSGERVTSVSTLTIADGLRTPLGEVPWSIIYERKLVSGMYTVEEDEIRRAMRLVYERMKMVVEPSAVVGLAVVLYNEDFRAMVEKEAGDKGWDVGLVFSGGNVNVDILSDLLKA